MRHGNLHSSIFIIQIYIHITSPISSATMLLNVSLINLIIRTVWFKQCCVLVNKATPLCTPLWCNRKCCCSIRHGMHKEDCKHIHGWYYTFPINFGDRTCTRWTSSLNPQRQLIARSIREVILPDLPWSLYPTQGHKLQIHPLYIYT